MISKSLKALAAFVSMNPKSPRGERSLAQAVLADEAMPEMFDPAAEGAMPFVPGRGNDFLKNPTAPPTSSARNPNVTVPRSRGVTPTPTALAEKVEIDRLMGMNPDRDRPQFERTAGGELITRHRGRAQRAELPTSLRGVIRREGDR